MATPNKFWAFSEHVAEGRHNLQSDSLKIYLSNTTPNAGTHAVKADLTEISAGNGYAAGGNVASGVTSVQASGTYKLVLQSPSTWFAAGGSIGPFQHAVLYNATSSGNPLICWWSYPSGITLADGETFTVVLSSASGVLTIA
jgi:hypothetical protein